MNRVIKKRLTYLIIVFMIALPAFMNAQPIPGDSEFSSANDLVVGGGADLGSNIWLWCIPAIFYLAFKWHQRYQNDKKFTWNWGE